MPGAIDIVINLHTPEVTGDTTQWYEGFLGGKIGADQQILDGLTMPQYLERMDRAGIDMAFFAAAKSGQPRASRELAPFRGDGARGGAGVPDPLSRPGRDRPDRGHGGRAPARVRDQRAGVRRRAPLPALVRDGARPPQVLSVLRQVRRAGRADPDAGGPLPALLRRIGRCPASAGRSCSTPSPATSPS